MNSVPRCAFAMHEVFALDRAIGCRGLPVFDLGQCFSIMDKGASRVEVVDGALCSGARRGKAGQSTKGTRECPEEQGWAGVAQEGHRRALEERQGGVYVQANSRNPGDGLPGDEHGMGGGERFHRRVEA